MTRQAQDKRLSIPRIEIARAFFRGLRHGEPLVEVAILKIKHGDISDLEDVRTAKALVEITESASFSRILNLLMEGQSENLQLYLVRALKDRYTDTKVRYVESCSDPLSYASPKKLKEILGRMNDGTYNLLMSKKITFGYAQQILVDLVQGWDNAVALMNTEGVLTSQEARRILRQRMVHEQNLVGAFVPSASFGPHAIEARVREAVGEL